MLFVFLWPRVLFALLATDPVLRKLQRNSCHWKYWCRTQGGPAGCFGNHGQSAVAGRGRVLPGSK